MKNIGTLSVGKVCLGTMSFGAHVNEETAFQIMDRALEMGVNFFDTAEMYPVPPTQKLYGVTEEIIGRWMKSRKKREKIILATKVTGPARKGHVDYIRGGAMNLNRKNMEAAIFRSLQRLQTDYIDLYQIHWPERSVNIFGQRAFIPRENENTTPIEETLEVLNDFKKRGLIREFGLSNESPWGIMKYLEIAKEKNFSKPVTVQNNYSLLTRTFDSALAEVSFRENVGLLAYSPLGYGVLGGRYLDGNFPEGGRFTVYPEMMPRYRTEKVFSLIQKYKKLAEKHQLTLPELALAFVYSRKFLTSCIIGPSNLEQLEECVHAQYIQLSKEIFDALDEIHEECPFVCA